MSTLNLARIVTAIYAVSLVIAVLWLRPGCVNLVVWASQEKSELLRSIAARYEQTRPSEDLRCVDITVVRKASGDAEQALRHDIQGETPPAVWTPAASTRVALLEWHLATDGARAIVPTAGGASILQSPLVIAMPEPMAKALGWPDKDITWREIFDLAQDPNGWTSRGHPEWGRFKLGKTNPLVSTSGLHALIATHQSSGGGAIGDAKVRAFMKGVESSVVHYGLTVSAFLKNLADADERGEALLYVSAIATEENQVWQYNEGNPEFRSSGTRVVPQVKLVAVHPNEGTLMADHPFVVLDAPWVDDLKRRAAAQFLAYLKSDPIQQEFQRNAFRSARGETGPVIDASPELDPTKPIRQFSVSDATLDQVQSSWKDYRKRARVLLVMDVSSSMGDRVGSAPASKLDLAKEAMSIALRDFTSDDEVGLWALAGMERRERIGVGPLRDQEAQLRSEIERLRPEGTGRALYATVMGAVTSLRQRFDRERINAVILLTDGRNDDPANAAVSGLLRTLRAQPEDERIRVFTIAYGGGADSDALDKIALNSRGARYDAADSRAIGRAVLDAVSNF